MQEAILIALRIFPIFDHERPQGVGHPQASHPLVQRTTSSSCTRGTNVLLNRPTSTLLRRTTMKVVFGKYDLL